MYSSHNAYINKYEVRNHSKKMDNLAALSVALCERGMRAVSSATEAYNSSKNSAWIIELSAAILVIEALQSLLDIEAFPMLKPVQELYCNMGSIAQALSNGRIPASRATDLLRLFTQTRDEWQNLDLKYASQQEIDLYKSDVL